KNKGLCAHITNSPIPVKNSLVKEEANVRSGRKTESILFRLDCATAQINGTAFEAQHTFKPDFDRAWIDNIACVNRRFAARKRSEQKIGSAEECFASDEKICRVGRAAFDNAGVVK